MTVSFITELELTFLLKFGLIWLTAFTTQTHNFLKTRQIAARENSEKYIEQNIQKNTHTAKCT